MITQDTLNILVENRLNDSKSWYDEHKPEIRKLVQEPFFEIIHSLAPTMRRIDPEIVTEPKTGRTLSRIHRDTRFSKDKSRYRDSIWLYFNRNKHMFPFYPSFFFELKPIYAWWGCGFYYAEPGLADSCRKMILDRDPIFMAAKDALDAQTTFRMDENDRFKRTRFPNEPEEFRDWLDRRSIYFVHVEEDVSSMFSNDLPDRLQRDFEMLVPLYRFLCTACDRAIIPDRVRRGR